MGAKKREFPGGRSVRFLQVQEIRRMERAEGEADDAPARFQVAVSSEHEVVRSGWFGKWREVLDHSKKSILMDRFKSGTAAVLVDHGGDQVGVVEKAWLDDDRVMRAEVRFSANPRGQEVQRDVEDGIRRNISVGYIPERAKLEEEDEEKGDKWRVTLWEPVELSFVSVPADPTVGVGRSASAGGTYPPVQVEGEEPGRQEGERTMKKVRNEEGKVVLVPDDDPRPEVRETEAPATTTEQKVVSTRNYDPEVLTLAKHFGYTVERATEWLEKGLDANAVRKVILSERVTAEPGKAAPASESMVQAGLDPKDARKYSFARAIMFAADGKTPDGVEGEVHAYLERNLPPQVIRRGGILAPLDLGVGREGAEKYQGKRTLVSNAVTKGAEAVTEEVGELIELLRNRTVIIGLGARTLSGLRSPVTFTKQTGAMAATWVGENPAAISESDVAMALALLAPKALMGATSYSRQFLAQANLDVESMVRDELSIVHSLALDLAGIHGLGANGEPTGVYKAVGVTAYSRSGGAGAFRYSDALTMLGNVAAANADLGTLGWLMNPVMAANLKGVLTFPSANTGTPVWEGNLREGTVAGYKAAASNQVSKVMASDSSDRSGGSQLGVVFGNWNDMIVGTWGALELVVDPYTSKKKGLIEVASFQMADILIRHGESFTKGTNFTG